MASQEFASEQASERKKKRRVVELEINPSNITVKPLKDAAKAVLLTSIGAGALTVQGIKNAVKAAHQAGAKAAENPDPVTNFLLHFLSEKEPEEVETPPIENYDTLAATDIVEHLDELEPEQLRILSAYESENKQRVTVLRAIDQRLGEESSQES